MDIKILGIETSCDETAASVVINGKNVVSNEVYSQIDIHREFGGVVPEIASRAHVLKLPYVVKAALKNANMAPNDLDAVAVTSGPGLVGALLTGVNYAKGFAYAAKKPLISVNHMEGHICSNYLSNSVEPPFICLVVSGGHTDIVYVEDYGRYKSLASTRDDAAGECFDKVARYIGLPYPGGVEIEKLAKIGKAVYNFPVPFKGEKHLDFSFSGLKTAVVNEINRQRRLNIEVNLNDIAASLQQVISKILVENTIRAARNNDINRVALAGGVSANQAVRDAFKIRTQAEGIKLYLPEKKYSTDNAAMIASAGYFRYIKNEFAQLSLNAYPNKSIL